MNASQFIGEVRRDGRHAQMHASGLEARKNSFFAVQGFKDRPIVHECCDDNVRRGRRFRR